jgi:hypothetical protein
MVQFASGGINLWAEWAKLETANLTNNVYKLPNHKNSYAGIVVSLSRFQHPDTSSFTDQEIVWRMQKDWHIGLIVVSESSERVLELLDSYTHRIARDFHASVPAPDKSM